MISGRAIRCSPRAAHLEHGPGGVLDLPHHHGGDLNGAAVGVVDLRHTRLVIPDARGPDALAAGRSRTCGAGMSTWISSNRTGSAVGLVMASPARSQRSVESIKVISQLPSVPSLRDVQA